MFQGSGPEALKGFGSDPRMLAGSEISRSLCLSCFQKKSGTEQLQCSVVNTR